MHGGGPLQRMSVSRSPRRLCDGLCRRGQGKQDEAIHLPLLLGAHGEIGIEAAFGIVGFGRYESGHACRKGGRPAWQCCES